MGFLCIEIKPSASEQLSTFKSVSYPILLQIILRGSLTEIFDAGMDEGFLARLELLNVNEVDESVNEGVSCDGFKAAAVMQEIRQEIAATK